MKKTRLNILLLCAITIIIAVVVGLMFYFNKSDLGWDVEEYKILDDAFALEFFAENSGKESLEFAKAYLSNTAFFGRDLTEYAGLAQKVAGYLDDIRTLGMREAIKKVNA